MEASFSSKRLSLLESQHLPALASLNLTWRLFKRACAMIRWRIA
jgi:hypothetical protein